MTRQVPPLAAAPTDTSADSLAEFPPEIRDAVACLPPLAMLPAVTEWSGYSTPGLYKSMDRGDFPRPLKLGAGGRIAWLRTDLARWLADRVATRTAAADAAARRAGGGR